MIRLNAATKPIIERVYACGISVGVTFINTVCMLFRRFKLVMT